MRTFVLIGDGHSFVGRVPPHVLLFTQYPLPPDVVVDVVVVGDGDLDLALLVDALLHAHRRTAVLPLEGGLELLQGTANWWIEKKRMREAVKQHEGLLLAKLLAQALRTELRWPEIDVLDRARSDTVGLDLRERSCMAEHGYTWILPDERRREILAGAVTPCGLSVIAATLFFLIVANERRGTAEEARRVWRGDLQWLRQRYPGTDIRWPG